MVKVCFCLPVVVNTVVVSVVEASGVVVTTVVCVPVLPVSVVTSSVEVTVVIPSLEWIAEETDYSSLFSNE